jgi:hypothetical protein
LSVTVAMNARILTFLAPSAEPTSRPIFDPNRQLLRLGHISIPLYLERSAL